jgi:rubrerythrin
MALQSIKEIEEVKASKAKEELENEQFNRWVCPVCKHKNFMIQSAALNVICLLRLIRRLLL